MKMDAMRRQAGRPSKNGAQLDHNFSGKKTREIIGEELGDSGPQVQRFIRLNNLIPALIDYVDDGKLAFNPAVEVSYLDHADQEIVFEIMDRDQISPSLSQAQKLHKLAAAEKISDSAIEAVMLVEKPMYETITLRKNTMEKYFPPGTSGREMEETIIKLLENMAKQRESKKTYDIEGKINMRICCYAPAGAFVLSAGTRLSPLNPYSAKRYFFGEDYCDEEFCDTSRLYDLASEAAEDIFTSCCPCVMDEFLCTVEDKEYDDAYDALVDVYKEIDRNVPLGIRAVAALPNAWAVFCAMVADELELMYEDIEDFEDAEENENDD